MSVYFKIKKKKSTHSKIKSLLIHISRIWKTKSSVIKLLSCGTVSFVHSFRIDKSVFQREIKLINKLSNISDYSFNWNKSTLVPLNREFQCMLTACNIHTV